MTASFAVHLGVMGAIAEITDPDVIEWILDHLATRALRAPPGYSSSVRAMANTWSR